MSVDRKKRTASRKRRKKYGPVTGIAATKSGDNVAFCQASVAHDAATPFTGRLPPRAKHACYNLLSLEADSFAYRVLLAKED
jgi:hypothetical protein